MTGSPGRGAISVSAPATARSIVKLGEVLAPDQQDSLAARSQPVASGSNLRGQPGFGLRPGTRDPTGERRMFGLRRNDAPWCEVLPVVWRRRCVKSLLELR